jgi:glycosyltransferase involved in cell wall biosynthesis
MRFVNHFKFLKRFKPNYIIYVQGGFLDFQFPEFLAGFLITKSKIFSLYVSGPPLPPKRTSKKHWNILSGMGLWWYMQMFFISLRGFLCKKILAVSETVKDELVKRYYYPQKRIYVKYHGIDLNTFRPDVQIREKMRRRYEIPNKDMVIISSARLSKEKCVHRLINAFDLSCQRFQGIHLFLLGDGPLRTEVEELVVQKSSKYRIKLLGFQDVLDYLKMSDIFVLPSDTEGLSRAMLEALAVGLISVITEVPGASEIIKDGFNGFLVERSENGVLNGIIKVLSLTEKQRKQISMNAREFVEEYFDIEKNIKEELRILGLNKYE